MAKHDRSRSPKSDDVSTAVSTAESVSVFAPSQFAQLMSAIGGVQGQIAGAAGLATAVQNDLQSFKHATAEKFDRATATLDEQAKKTQDLESGKILGVPNPGNA